MQDASDKKRALEKEHKECVVQLQDKQRELQNKPSSINYAEKTRLCEHIESLQVNRMEGFFLVFKKNKCIRVCHILDFNSIV